MKLYSDTLTELAITHVVRDVEDVYVDRLDPLQRPRVRSRGWDFRLASMTSNRYRNSGQYGASTWDSSPATWDQHGEVFARLFEIDPNARIGDYNGRDEFHRVTDGKYRLGVTA